MKSSPPPHVPVLTPDQQRLLRAYGQMNAEGRGLALEFMEGFVQDCPAVKLRLLNVIKGGAS